MTDKELNKAIYEQLGYEVREYVGSNEVFFWSTDLQRGDGVVPDFANDRNALFELCNKVLIGRFASLFDRKIADYIFGYRAPKEILYVWQVQTRVLAEFLLEVLKERKK